MISIKVIFAILITHYVADFIFQSHYQASNKSKNNYALGAHVFIYMFFLQVLAIFLFTNQNNRVLWVGINGGLHFATDYITSRINSKMFAKQDWHNFFVGVGADQLFHYICLFSTYLMLS